MNTLKKIWMNFKHSSLLYQTITKNVLGYFQVNSEILETRISSSSKFVPQKNSSSIFKFEPEKVQEVQVFLYQVISSLLPSLVGSVEPSEEEENRKQNYDRSEHNKNCPQRRIPNFQVVYLHVRNPITQLTIPCINNIKIQKQI